MKAPDMSTCHFLARRRSLLAAAACLALPWAASAADAWPSKPLTIVSPYSAGGITDLLCRIVGEELAKALGQSVVVENRTGASGGIAHMSVAKAPPDGYTLIMGGSAPTAITPALNKSASYGPKDFEPIGYVAELPIVLAGHTSIPGSTARFRRLLRITRHAVTTATARATSSPA
jgi:tripartite-type tricarboxylate transporter receptor subunit TctC